MWPQRSAPSPKRPGATNPTPLGPPRIRSTTPKTGKRCPDILCPRQPIWRHVPQVGDCGRTAGGGGLWTALAGAQPPPTEAHADVETEGQLTSCSPSKHLGSQTESRVLLSQCCTLLPFCYRLLLLTWLPFLSGPHRSAWKACAPLFIRPRTPCSLLPTSSYAAIPIAHSVTEPETPPTSPPLARL